MGISLSFQKTVTAQFKTKFPKKDNFKEIFGCKKHGEVGQVKHCPECGKRLEKYEINLLKNRFDKVLSDLYNSSAEMNEFEEEFYCEGYIYFSLENDDDILRVTIPINEDDCDDDGFYTDSDDNDGYRFSWIFNLNEIQETIKTASEKYVNILKALETEFGEYELNFSFTRCYG